METFESFSNRWQQTILPMKKPASRSTISSHIRQLAEKIGARPLAELQYAEIQSMFSELSKERAPRTVKNLHGAYRLLMGQAVKEGLLEEYPKPILPKLRKSQQDWLQLDQMKKVIKAADVKLKPLVALLAEAGPRIGECLGLMASDINDQTLSIERSVWSGKEQDPKTDNAVRKMYISANLRDMLRGCATDGFLFKTRSGRPAWPTELRRHIDPLLESLGIQPVGFHAWRRGNATALASQFSCPEKILGVRLGHAHQGLTLGTYAQAIDGADKPYVDAYSKELYGE